MKITHSKIPAMLISLSFLVSAPSSFADTRDELGNYYNSESTADIFNENLEKLLKDSGRQINERNKMAIVKILKQVETFKDPKKLEGLGVVILVDLSGSMTQPIKKNGIPKIETAEKAVNATLDSLRAFGQANPNKKIQVAVEGFSRETVTIMSSRPSQQITGKFALEANGGTAIGDALLRAKSILTEMNAKSSHIILISDGENTDGQSPETVLMAMQMLKNYYADNNAKTLKAFAEKPSIHMIAFGIRKNSFSSLQPYLSSIREAGSENELVSSMDKILEDEVLAEKEGQDKEDIE